MTDRDEPCAYRCGYWYHGDDLLQHEFEDHRTCPVCGAEPDPDYGLRHHQGCARITESEQDRRARWAAYIAASRARAR